MTPRLDAHLRSVFHPDEEGPIRALVVAGACGNVGFGKLGQFARLLVPHGVPVVALDLSDRVLKAKDQLKDAYGTRLPADAIETVLAGITVVRGGVDDLPSDLRAGFVFEAIPERLPVKHGFYRSLRARDPDAYIFSATSGFPSSMLFEGLDGAERCGVMHPFYPHLTNKLWEVPVRGAVTGTRELAVVQRFLGGLGMTLVGTADVPSFAADRLFCGMMLEAVRIHADLGLSPAQIDDVCKQTLGTSPFFVHNLIPGANYLSAHCMELLGGEVGSSLFTVPEAWKPYVEDPAKAWPYDRNLRCPPERFEAVRDRMLGMLICLTAYMLKHEIASIDAINFLAEKALAFREGPPAQVQTLGFARARAIATEFLERQNVTQAEVVAPLDVLSDDANVEWWTTYVHTSVRDGVGLLSLKRTTLTDMLIVELDRALSALQADPAVGAIVIAPDGRLSREFGHGADLQAFVPVLGDEHRALELINRWKQTLGKLRAGKPTVAAVVGRVLGGSLELALSCHARIAGKGARFAFPETTVGVIPGLGGCHHAHRFSSPEHFPRLNELLLTGHSFTVDDAVAMGMVSESVPVPQLPDASARLAGDLADGRVPIPAFRTEPATCTVDRNVCSTNEAGLALDARLRSLLAETVEGANGLPYPAGSALEARNAAASLAMSSSAIGVKAMLRGKPPRFEHPLPPTLPPTQPLTQPLTQ